MTPGSSLRAALIRRLTIPLVLVVIVGACFDYTLTVLPGLETYDKELAGHARVLTELLAAYPGNAAAVSKYAQRLVGADAAVRTYYQIADPNGRIAAGSPLIAAFAESPEDDEARLFDSRVGGIPVRVAAAKRDGYIVQVAQTTEERDGLVRRMLLSVVVPDLVLGMLVILIVWYGIVNGVAPLAALGTELKARAPGDLRPLAAVGPAEVQPLVHAMNDLLGRLRASSEMQRRFLASAAHQLRTPLAALSTQAELAYRNQRTPELGGILSTLRQDAVRTAHLAEQLLTLARADPASQVAERMKPLDLKDVVEQTARTWVPRALRKNIDMGFDVESAQIIGDRLLIQELLTNLLDNAIAYTPDGGVVTINTRAIDGQAVLTVQDNGIGIPQSAHEKVFERFFRVPGTMAPGSGLGLAIVKDIVAAHRGRVSIETPESHGTLFKVVLPLAA
jgi:two-component system sensor histidine kinase TctE